MPIYELNNELMFPPHRCAEDGLLAVGGDLRPERLLLAYTHGIFPWYNEDDPILWWSPDPRMIMLPNRVHVSESLKRTLKKGVFKFTLDTAFDAVIQGCANTPRNGQPGTWIVPEMRAAYNRLYELGYAHSVEVWKDGALAGGLYGVSLGSAFFGESMFSLETDASKAALAVFSRQLCRWHFTLIDCQVPNDHLRRLGGFEMPRNTFLRWLSGALQTETRRGRWRLDSPLAPRRIAPPPAKVA